MKSLITTACLIGLSTFAFAQTAEEIVNQYLDNIGGRSKLEAIQATQMEAKVDAGGMTLPVKMIQTKKGESMISFELQGRVIVQQAFDGTTAWGVNFQTMKAEKSESEVSENMKRSLGDFPDAFLNYKANGYTLEKMADETVEGTSCFKIKLTKKKQLSEGKEVENVVYYFFDKNDMVPIMTETEVMSGPAKGTIAQTVLSEYQEVDGVYFPFSITQRSKGGPGQTIVIDKVIMNPTIDSKLFKFEAQ